MLITVQGVVVEMDNKRDELKTIDSIWRTIYLSMERDVTVLEVNYLRFLAGITEVREKNEEVKQRLVNSIKETVQVIEKTTMHGNSPLQELIKRTNKDIQNMIPKNHIDLVVRFYANVGSVALAGLNNLPKHNRIVGNKIDNASRHIKDFFIDNEDFTKDSNGVNRVGNVFKHQKDVAEAKEFFNDMFEDLKEQYYVSEVA